MVTDEQVPVVILCGGRGTRLQERAASIPKPLVEIGGWPIVWHVIQVYAAQGLRRFLLSTGYKADMVESFVTSCDWPAGVHVTCVDTGLDTPTGGRIKLLATHLDGARFHATYADGVANVDITGLTHHHHTSGLTATMTVVRPLLPFGVTDLDDAGRVRGFREKPRSEHWINGGFMCFESEALAYIGEDTILERDPMERLAADGALGAYRHEGFWDCMDTYKDAVLLNDLWSQGGAPWKVW